jgi:hypothetical protein
MIEMKSSSAGEDPLAAGDPAAADVGGRDRADGVRVLAEVSATGSP